MGGWRSLFLEREREIMEYRILCGKEHKLVLSDDIYSENQFMYQAYCEARNALSEIVRYSDEFYGKTFAPEALFESLQNIIAFSGRRGQGKTSTMLSFSDALKCGNLVDPDLKEHTYEVLAPIDPTILEEKQNILALVLARMYRRADEIWAHGGSEYTSGRRGPTEADKNELLASFQRCLTGINAIKYKTDKEIKSLTDISIVSDSATLKQDIHDLIKKYLRFVGNADETKGFLVIQLDDTDFQVIKGHEILEDIRKYLSIPNVIVLMATDLTMLRTVVLQHYVKIFKAGIDEKIIDANSLAKIESKYMDKIVPPVHAIHLPRLEEYVLRYGNQMKFIYEDSNSNNILFDETRPGDNSLLSPQELILRYIYRKTGIVFVSEESSYHGIIPTTLRGLAQLLSLLNSLDDIPQISVERMKVTSQLIEAEKERTKIAEKNISRFEKYFLNEWVRAKLSPREAEKIEKMAGMVQSERIEYAVSILNETEESKSKNISKRKIKYIELIQLLDDMVRDNREQKDIFLILAVQTCLTISNHKIVLRQIRAAIDEYKEGALLFDFSPAKSYLPSMYLSTRHLEDQNPIILFEKKPNKYEKPFKTFIECLFQDYNIDNKTKTCFSYLHIATIVQSFGSPNMKLCLNEETPQEFLYQSQMAVAMLITNLEVQMRVNSDLERYSKDGFREGMNSNQLSKMIYRTVEDSLLKINRGSKDAPIMTDINFYEIQQVKNEDEEDNSENKRKYIITDAAAVLREIDAIYDSTPELVVELVRLYRIALEFAENLKLAKKDLSAIDYTYAESFSIELSRFLSECQAMYSGITTSTDSVFDLTFADKIQYGVTTSNAFIRSFNNMFGKLCRVCNVSLDYIKSSVKGSMKI